MARKIVQRNVCGRGRLRVAAVQMKFAPTIEENLAKIERLVGSPVFRRGKLYNCLVVFDRQGAATHCYAKCHLTETDRSHFAPGSAVALFEIDGVSATTVICHERRYPELARLAVMAGARAFENAIYYVFANSVGPQGSGKWSAGDSKIVGPDEKVLALADNRSEAVIKANLDLAKATGVYAQRGLTRPPFLAPHWKRMVDAVRSQAAKSSLAYDLPSAASVEGRR